MAEVGKVAEVGAAAMRLPEGFDPNARLEPMQNQAQGELAPVAADKGSDAPTDMSDATADIPAPADVSTDVEMPGQEAVEVEPGVGDVQDAGTSDVVEASDDAGTSEGVEKGDLHEGAEDGRRDDAAEASKGDANSDDNPNRVDDLFSKLEGWLDTAKDRLDVGQWDWVDHLYTDASERIQRACYTVGEWLGEPGNSRISPAMETPLGRAAYEKMQQFGETSVRYIKGVVDFSPFAVASARIDNMTSDLWTNKAQGFKALADKFNQERPLSNGEQWDQGKVQKWARENGLEFHECSDMQTIQLVPKEIHQYFKHYGGRAEIKALERMSGIEPKAMGGFDD